MSDFAARLLRWFDDHGRKNLPWQQAISPYRVWVSEIMLQQTQVTTVIPYYKRFMHSFPNVVALADAGQDDVLSHWSGLGYYARARNLHKAARVIRDDHGGVFPESFDDVVALPGIGRSTAGAILSIACNQRHPILDGNVKRVLARHEAIEGWPGKTSVANKLWEIAEKNTPEKRVADYTQAIMDLGATLCTRSNPSCESCPVAFDCTAKNSVSVTLFPGKKPKKTKPLRKTTMVLAEAGAHVLLERRPEAGIWGGLWSLPEVNDGSVEDWCGDALSAEAVATEFWDVVRHSFSHYDLDIHPVVVRVATQASKVADSQNETWHPLGAELPGGIAAPVKKLIEELGKNVSHC
ncbi:MAG: A/G-specific adenine glycosylase [Pseudomonadota bacterium]